MEEKSECKGMAGGNFFAVGIILVGGDGYKNVCVLKLRGWEEQGIQELSVQRSGQDSMLSVILNAAVYTWLPRLRSRRPRLGRPLTSSASLLMPLRIFQALSVRASLG